ncbi:YadA-like family protein [Novosphingobium sp. SL115]|uniref:beta strand repeat-containing protein n=1 Tax=Novosphingobium sp. SL115 TaxID=2995150 RepID=UPI002272948D|nr:YadA-like family protein [Novosphingobium sp. SL115]MCY1669810.1 YadA-like family protein [Novosphingobium sp. SL115]
MKLKYLISTSTAVLGLIVSGSAVAQQATSGTFATSIPNAPPPTVDAESFTGGIVGPSSNAFNIVQINANQSTYQTSNFQTGVADYNENGSVRSTASIYNPITDTNIGGNFDSNVGESFGSATQNHAVAANGGVTVKTTTSYLATDSAGNGAISGATVTTTETGVQRDYALTGSGTTTVSDINVGGVASAVSYNYDAEANNYGIEQAFAAYSTTGFNAETQTASVEQNVTSIGTSGSSYTTYAGTASYAVTPVLDENGNVVLDSNGLPLTTGGVSVAFNETPTNQTLVTSAGVTTTGSLQAGNVSISGNTVSTGGNGNLVLHGGTNSTEVTLGDAGFAVTSARFARDEDGNVIVDEDGNPTYASTLTPTLTVSNEGAVTVYGQIGGVVAGTEADHAVNLGQMNAADAVLSGQIAQEVLDRTAGDAATLASANSFTTTSVAAEASARVAGDAATLSSAKSYADAGDATTLASAKSFTTSAVASEAALRTAGDAATLASAKSYTDNAVGAERNARMAADNVLRDQIASSTATAIALGGATILPDSNFTLSGNVGFYEGASALAVNAAARVSESAYITGAFGGGLNKNGQVGGRVGVVFGF